MAAASAAAPKPSVWISSRDCPRAARSEPWISSSWASVPLSSSSMMAGCTRALPTARTPAAALRKSG